jgi:hypothetical protein
MSAIYEARSTPDGWPVVTADSLREVERRAVRYVEKRGCGELLVYQVDDRGERYIGAVC